MIRKQAKPKPCGKISELDKFSSGRRDTCLDNLKLDSIASDSLFIVKMLQVTLT